jgi:hypothetical protein
MAGITRPANIVIRPKEIPAKTVEKTDKLPVSAYAKLLLGRRQGKSREARDRGAFFSSLF